jgi:hypothetical protein
MDTFCCSEVLQLKEQFDLYEKYKVVSIELQQQNKEYEQKH